MKKTNIKPEIVATAEALGLELKPVGKELQFTIPWREDTHPSGQLNSEKGQWFDNARNESGDAFDLIQRSLKVGFIEAVKWSEKKGLVKRDTIARNGGYSKPAKPKDRAANWVWKSAKDATAKFEALQSLKSDSAAMEFLRADYGLTATMVPADWKLFDHAQHGRGVVYRATTASGEFAYKYRSLGRKENGKRNAAFLHGPSTAAIFKSRHDKERTCIVGGEEKGIAAFHAGYTVFSPLTGEHKLSDDALDRIIQFAPEEIVIANDAGEAGDKANRAIADQLVSRGYPRRKIRMVKWADDAPDGQDLNDVLKAGGLDGLVKLLDDAPTIPHSGLSMMDIEELLGLQLPEHDNLLGDRLLSCGEALAIIGPAGIGKSGVIMQGAFDLILGRDWCGIPTHARGRRVLFFQTENSARRMQHDIQHRLRGVSADDRALLKECLRFLVPLKDMDRFLSLADSEAIMRMIAVVIEFKPDIVIFDPLAEFFGGDNENDAVAMRDCFRQLMKIARSGNPDAAVIILHHSRVGKAAAAGASGYEKASYGRGSKALYSCVRSQVNLAPGSPDDPKILVMACAKSNNGPLFLRRAIRLTPQTMTYSVDPDFDFEDWERELTGKTPPKTKKGLSALMTILSEGPLKYNALKRALMEVTGDSESTAKRTITAAFEAKKIKQTGEETYALRSG